MSVTGKRPLDAADGQEQQTQTKRNTGEGSGSAMAAMLKKRREGENHPDDEQARRSDSEPTPQQ
jgi:hypothetical protein